MNPAETALWFIESHFARDISLDDVAGIGGVTRYHVTQALAAATGMPVEPIAMDDNPPITLKPPRIETGKTLLIAA